MKTENVFNLNETEDLKVVKWQIERDTAFIGGVARRCDYGFPSVIYISPEDNISSGLLNVGFVSNLLWLTCPHLVREIHKIESNGAVKKMQDYISKNMPLKRQMDMAHVKYYYLRKRSYGHLVDFHPALSDLNIMNTGIGGIRDTDNIKCLHLHYAHSAVCQENFAGRAVTRMLDKKMCCCDVTCRQALER